MHAFLFLRNGEPHYYSRVDSRKELLVACLKVLLVKTPECEDPFAQPVNARIKFQETTVYVGRGPDGDVAIEYANGAALIKSLQRTARRIVGLKGRIR